MNGIDFSREELAGLIVFQPKRGYRFSIDAFLLADFVHLKPGELALELGAGCGIISLLVGRRFPKTRLVALEIQERLFRCLVRNVQENRLGNRIWAIRGDLRYPPFKAGRFDVVFTNPPFYPLGTGRLSPNEEERLARHEILATLKEVISSSSWVLKNRGRLLIIYPAKRLDELILVLGEHGFRPKKLQLIHSYPGDEARLLRLQAIKGGGAELKILPPFFIYDRPGGGYTAEAQALFELSKGE